MSCTWREALVGLSIVVLATACGSDSETESGGSGGKGGTSGADAGLGGSGGAAATGGGGSGGKAAGQSCTEASECAAGYCADGVCCDSACDGPCESCAAGDAAGTCTPAAAGTDPDADCGSGGADGGQNLCVGTCDGQGACLFPGTDTTCGASSCSAGTQIDLACDGAGDCAPATSDCGLYSCNASTCNASCSGDLDCANNAYCTGGKCYPKKIQGDPCAGNNECTTGFCINNTCCQTDCASPSSCTSGQCLCAGKTCTTGITCEKYFLDMDGDGYGKESSGVIVACSDNNPGPDFELNDDDCWDNNGLAFPGATGFYTADRGDGSYDYNCDGIETSQYAKVSSLITSCTDCGFQYPVTNQCGACGALVGGIVPQYTMGLECTGAPKCSGVKTREAFNVVVGCGKTGTLYKCPSTSCDALTSAPVVQGCH